jgi:hypothetical protein
MGIRIGIRRKALGARQGLFSACLVLRAVCQVSCPSTPILHDSNTPIGAKPVMS